MRSEQGTTLIELMVTLTILVILLTIAVPSFQQLMINNSLAGISNDLIGSLDFARSEAVKRSTPVTICASSDQATCVGTWSQGWIIFIDNNASGSVDAGDNLLRVHEPLVANYTAAATLTAGVSYVVYNRSGMANDTGTFAICHSADAPSAKIISVTLTRPRVAPDVAIATCAAP